jgi:thiol-disulfide isomerase/thioredoxin
MRRWRDCGILFAFVCACSAATPASLPPELNSLQGRVIYLDFWASWCTPCRQSFPWMQDLQTQYASHGLTVIAVNLDQDRAAADAFLKRFHPGFQQPEWRDSQPLGTDICVAIGQEFRDRTPHVFNCPGPAARGSPLQ